MKKTKTCVAVGRKFNRIEWAKICGIAHNGSDYDKVTTIFGDFLPRALFAFLVGFGRNPTKNKRGGRQNPQKHQKK